MLRVASIRCVHFVPLSSRNCTLILAAAAQSAKVTFRLSVYFLSLLLTLVSPNFILLPLPLLFIAWLVANLCFLVIHATLYPSLRRISLSLWLHVLSISPHLFFLLMSFSCIVDTQLIPLQHFLMSQVLDLTSGYLALTDFHSADYHSI